MDINFKNSRFLRYLTNFWTVVVFAAVIFDFFKNGFFEEIISPLLVVYVALLAIYAGDKEFERWHDLHSSRHPGEVFVILWTALVLALLIVNFVFPGERHISGEVLSTYIAVISILAITRRSKLIYNSKKHK